MARIDREALLLLVGVRRGFLSAHGRRSPKWIKQQKTKGITSSSSFPSAPMLAPLVALLVALDVVAGVPSSKRFVAQATHEQRSRIPTGWVQHTGDALAKRGLDAPALDKKSFTVYVARDYRLRAVSLMLIV